LSYVPGEHFGFRIWDFGFGRAESSPDVSGAL